MHHHSPAQGSHAGPTGGSGLCVGLSCGKYSHFIRRPSAGTCEMPPLSRARLACRSRLVAGPQTAVIAALLPRSPIHNPIMGSAALSGSLLLLTTHHLFEGLSSRFAVFDTLELPVDLRQQVGCRSEQLRCSLAVVQEAELASG